MNRLSKTITYIIGIGFLLNLIWENAQAPLYQGYVNFWQHFLICLSATAGDVLILAILYAIIAGIRWNIYWISDIRTSDIFILVILGFFVATGIELRALSFDKWSYTASMPLLPIFNIGIAPVLQMMILPLVTFSMASKYTRI